MSDTARVVAVVAATWAGLNLLGLLIWMAMHDGKGR
jgi:hypothetical protein